MSEWDSWTVIVEDDGCYPLRNCSSKYWTENRVVYAAVDICSTDGKVIDNWLRCYHRCEWEVLWSHFEEGFEKGWYEPGGTIVVVENRDWKSGLGHFEVTVSKKRKEEARVCEKCKYYGNIGWIPNWPSDDFGYICRRRQVKSVNPVNGFDKWDGKMLKCTKEREIDVSWWEQLVGKCCRRDRCGKEGKYWVRR